LNLQKEQGKAENAKGHKGLHGKKGKVLEKKKHRGTLRRIWRSDPRVVTRKRTRGRPEGGR